MLPQQLFAAWLVLRHWEQDTNQPFMGGANGRSAPSSCNSRIKKNMNSSSLLHPVTWLTQREDKHWFDNNFLTRNSSNAASISPPSSSHRVILYHNNLGAGGPWPFSLTCGLIAQRPRNSSCPFDKKGNDVNNKKFTNWNDEVQIYVCKVCYIFSSLNVFFNEPFIM